MKENLRTIGRLPENKMQIDFYVEFEGIELDQAEALITSQFRNIFDRAYVAIKSENDGISVAIEQPVPQYNEYDVEFIIQALYDYVPVLGQMGVFIDQQSINVSFTDENLTSTTVTTTSTTRSSTYSESVVNGKIDEDINLVLIIKINHLYLESIDLKHDLSIIQKHLEMDFEEFLKFSKHQYGDAYVSFNSESAGYDNGYDVDIKLAIVFEKLG